MNKIFNINDKIKKVTGDYRFTGVVVAVFTKRNGTSIRVVAENDDGIVHIFSPAQLEKDE